jgi:hypothetical protein
MAQNDAVRRVADVIKARDAARASEVILKVVAYLRKEATAFDCVLTEELAAGLDASYAQVKRRAIQTMADRIEAGEWLKEQG